MQTDKTPLVSILVPVYNTPEPFLRQCLDSLINQTLREIEIIVIDDGSTSNAPAVIAAYAARDPRIRVLTKQNSGYGDSMNQGIAAARGTWIGLCEPDDFADRRMFAALAQAGEEHQVDIVKSNFIEHFDEVGGRRARLKKLLGRSSVLERPKIIFDDFPYDTPFAPAEHPAIVRVMPAIWAALYRRQLIVDAGIQFSPTPGASFQDTSFVHQCWIAARRVLLLRDCLLHYRMDNAASSSKSGAKVMAICGEYERTFAFLRARGDKALHAFGPMLNATRFDGYMWNYDRIAPEFHLAFAQRWADDMRAQMEAGLVDESLLSERYRLRLELLLTSPEDFCAVYPKGIDL